MIRFYQLAQTDFLIKLLEGVKAEFGVLAAFSAGILILLLLLYIGQRKADTERKEAETERLQEDTKRDKLISDMAGKYANEIGDLREKIARSEGVVDLLKQQLTTESEKRLELRDDVRELSAKINGHEARIKELQDELNSKADEIKALQNERDTLKQQIADADAKSKRLDNTIADLLKERDELNGKIGEQAEQIKSLATQLAALDPPKEATMQGSELVKLDEIPKTDEETKEKERVL